MRVCLQLKLHFVGSPVFPVTDYTVALSGKLIQTFTLSVLAKASFSHLVIKVVVVGLLIRFNSESLLSLLLTPSSQSWHKVENQNFSNPPKEEYEKYNSCSIDGRFVAAGSNGLGLSHCVVLRSCARQFTLTVALSTQVYLQT